VDDRNVQQTGGDAPHHRVGVAEEDGGGRLELLEDRVELRDDGADDLGVRLTDCTELDVGRVDVELAEEDVLQVVRVVLTGPDEDDVVARLGLEPAQDQRSSDQIRPDAEDDRDLSLVRRLRLPQNQRTPSRCNAARMRTMA
jgi:hypothetical protein